MIFIELVSFIHRKLNSMIIRLEPRPKRTWIFTKNSWAALNMQCPTIVSLLTNNAFYLRRLQDIDFENLK